MQMDTPLLLIHFNRPDYTQRQLSHLLEIRPTRLWVLCDGAREGPGTDEAAKVEEVRRLLSDLPWSCEVEYRFRDENWGVFANISDGISWFLEDAGAGIILEDDCIPNRSFYRFMQELLERYQSDDEVMCLSGYTDHEVHSVDDHSYTYSNYYSCWGWATWKSAWEQFDSDMSAYTDRSIWKRIEANVLCGIRQRLYWRMICRRLIQGRCDSWAYRFQLSLWKSGGLSVIPKQSLVVNHGFGEGATNTKGLTHFGATQEEMDFPLSHPGRIQVDRRIDRWIENHWHSKSLPVRWRWLKSKVFCKWT